MIGAGSHRDLFEIRLLAVLVCLVGAGTCVADPPATSAPAPAQRPADRSAPEDYSLDVRSVTRVVATLTCDVSYPDAKARDWVVFASQAPDLPGQIKTETTLTPVGSPVREKGEFSRALLMGRVRADADHPFNSLKIDVTYEATLRSRRLRQGSPRKVADLQPQERERYLAEGGFFDFSQPAFREWVEQHGLERGGKESEIHFARRVFLALKGCLQYDSPPRNDFRATAVCKNGRGDCGGMSVLFASILRANHIPARTLWGRWAHSSKPGKTWYNRPYYEVHVKAEFFGRGVGWIPVDVASGILHDTSKQGLKFFGNDPGDFIAFHIDGNFDLDTLLFGVKSVGNFQTPRWWIKGKGTLKDEKRVMTWQVSRSKAN